jgi:hypothetical protein
MAGTWVYAHHLPFLCEGDATRAKRQYEGEEWETRAGQVWDWGYGPITEMWEVTESTRNGWYTLTRNVRGARSGMWAEAGETLRVRGRKNLPMLLVSISPEDFRWETVQKKHGYAAA